VNDCWSCRRILALVCLFLVATSPSFSQANKLVNAKTLPVNFEVNRGQTSPDIQFGSPANGTPAGTYTIVVTGSSGGSNQTTSLTLTVQ
jgi:hypothetical protein